MVDLENIISHGKQQHQQEHFKDFITWDKLPIWEL
jgi:hypothetical protein